jgi:hypothetical protein
VVVKEIIRTVLAERLGDATYSAESMKLSKDISEEVKRRLKELHLPRYKFFVQVRVRVRRRRVAAARCCTHARENYFACDLPPPRDRL